MRWLSQDGLNSKMLLCTGAAMERTCDHVLHMRRVSFQPRHKNNLANEFACYVNYDSKLMWSGLLVHSFAQNENVFKATVYSLAVDEYWNHVISYTYLYIDYILSLPRRPVDLFVAWLPLMTLFIIKLSCADKNNCSPPRWQKWDDFKRYSHMII
jgi:hypothetical protein